MNEEPAHTQLCLNCGASADTRFCPECGQESISTLISFRALIGQFLDDFLSLDSTFARSLITLLFKPGRLSLEYSRGRRKRFASPIRIYLIASVTFFLVASFMVSQSTRGSGSRRGLSPAATDSTSTTSERADPGNPLWTKWIPLPDSVSVAIDDEIRALAPHRYEMDRFDLRAIGDGDTAVVPTWMARRLELPSLPDSVRTELSKMDPDSLHFRSRDGDTNTTISLFGTSYEVDERELVSEIFSITPKMLFVLFPIFALFLQLIYIRRKRYYVEHLVFSLHCHAFLFLVLTLVVLLQQGELVPFAIPLIGIYVYAAMKRFYSQGWFKTWIKFTLLSGGYLILVLFVAILTMIASVWMITGFETG